MWPWSGNEKWALRRFLWINNLHTVLPSLSFSSSSCVQRTSVAELLFYLSDRALSRKRWGTELIVVAAIGDRAALDCRWVWELGAAIDCYQGYVFYSLGVSGRPSQDCLACGVTACMHPHTHTYTHKQPSLSSAEEWGKSRGGKR